MPSAVPLLVLPLLLTAQIVPSHAPSLATWDQDMTAAQQDLSAGRLAEVATDYDNLAKLYAKERKDAQAKTLYQQALAIQEKTLGPEHEEFAATERDYAALQHKGSRQ